MRPILLRVTTDLFALHERHTPGEIRLYEEMAKRTIRVVDGHRADWAGRKTAAGSVVRFWEEIGPKARMFVINQYLQTHTPNAEETADFFLNCCVYRTAAVG